MDKTQEKYAYRCLPMVIANQHSWDALCPSDIKLAWEGDDSFDGIRIEYLEPSEFKFASSLFGYGIVTFHVDFVLQTEENICIYVKGPANYPRVKLYPLEGIVETNWLPFTFTSNWKFTEPGEIIITKGEPLFSFFPVNTNLIEEHIIEKQNINSNQEFKVRYDNYADSRTLHNKNGKTNGASWQKNYMKGLDPFDNSIHKNHKTKLKVN
jgi:hypothetical protein